MHFVYIISNPNKTYYKGYTTNPVGRLEQHNEGKSRYTKGKGPWKLLFLRSFTDKSEALQYEKMLKRQNHKYLEWLIFSNKNEIAGGRLG